MIDKSESVNWGNVSWILGADHLAFEGVMGDFRKKNIYYRYNSFRYKLIQSKCTANISRHMFFLFTQYNYTSGNRNIFAVSLLKFVSKRLFFLCRLHSWSHAKCVTLIKLCDRPLSLTNSNIKLYQSTKPIVNALARPFKLRSCENKCRYSWEVKFNNEIVYYRHLTYYIDSTTTATTTTTTTTTSLFSITILYRCYAWKMKLAASLLICESVLLKRKQTLSWIL